jgi:Mor family transcriptional regulator
MNGRLRFVARLFEGEKMAVLCREFEISRKTVYKICRQTIGARIRPGRGSHCRVFL